jgi:hypothetical protein
MLSRYEIEHVILAEQYTDSRKIVALNKLKDETESQIDVKLIEKVKKDICGKQSEEDVIKKLQKEDVDHWVEVFGRRAAADLLTLGKVQPETMLAMSALPPEDFIQAIKVASLTAKRLNDTTIVAENDLNNNLIPDEMI